MSTFGYLNVIDYQAIHRGMCKVCPVDLLLLNTLYATIELYPSINYLNYLLNAI